MANPLVELQRLGQSPWHDNIRRELLTSGKLRQMVEDGWITGLTSNPTIFEQAISQSDDYDRQLERLAREGLNAEKIFDALAIDDIRNAADVFRPVFDRTHGDDGYVSIEVAPRHANDTQQTIREARRLWETVDRPNLMVKIPATQEGVPAIERSIADGINVNVTLIFSLQRYDEVMNAYLNGLIQRGRSGLSLRSIASVASFFVSRVDTLVDKLLDERIASASPDVAYRLEQLKGKAAIANAKLAYEAFRRKFSVEAYAMLANEGARRQRPLWASTSTKNPSYPDTYYIEALVGPDSVDTMPPATLEAYADHGDPQVRIDQGLDEARRVMEQLADAGIRMDDVTRKLEVDGVASFTASFDSLIRVVEERRQAILATAGAGKKKVARKRAKAPARRAGGTRKAAGKKTAVARSRRGKAASANKRSAKKVSAKRVAVKKVAVKKRVTRKSAGSKSAGKKSAPKRTAARRRAKPAKARSAAKAGRGRARGKVARRKK